MNRPTEFLLAASASALVLATLVTAEPLPIVTAPQQTGRLPLEQGEALVVRMCNECHDVKTVLTRRRTRAEWEHSLNDMIQEGASGTAKDFEDVYAHLVATRGKVFINEAKADEIGQVLGLSPGDADAIVDYRTKTGRFADLAELQKVPGIDSKVLDARVEAIAF